MVLKDNVLVVVYIYVVYDCLYITNDLSLHFIVITYSVYRKYTAAESLRE